MTVYMNFKSHRWFGTTERLFSLGIINPIRLCVDKSNTGRMTSTRGTAIDRNIEQAIDEVAGIIYWADVFQHEEEGVRGSARR